MMRPETAARPLQLRLSAALTHHQRGETARAESLYRGILEHHPGCFDALHLLGVALTDRGAVEEAIGILRRAVSSDPAQANAHYALARALVSRGQTNDAIDSLGVALELQPLFADAWVLRGNLLLASGRFEEAVPCYERAIRAQRNSPEAFCNLCAALRALKRMEHALQCADAALARRPNYAKALNNRGLVLLDMRRHTAAVQDWRRALAAEPEFPEALHNLGSALSQLRRFEEAREVFERLAVVAPGFPHLQGNLLHAKLGCCDWSGIDALRDAVITEASRENPVALPMSFLGVSGSARLQHLCARSLIAHQYPERHTPPRAAVGRADGRIRVAYLSADFGEHAVSYLLADVLARHDPGRFETLALSWGRGGEGPMRRRVEQAFREFIDITSTGDAEVVRMMQERGVDIAVDLTGHTMGQRTDILACRCAPVQVNYLGYPGTMGAPYVDYLIADPFAVPDEHRAHYSEHVVWLPCFQPSDARRVVPAATSRLAHSLPEDAFVFCAFNNAAKLNPECFGVWMRLLRAVPSSVLWVIADGQAAADNLRREAVSRGVEASRIVCARRADYGEYLARYAVADLFLDSFPFNGGATAGDALFMGVPVVTLAGDSFSARMAGSLMSTLGLPDLVTFSAAAYEAVALRLAECPDLLSAARRQLVEARESHGFFDPARYCRQLESAYQVMHERSAAGLPPAAFSVPPWVNRSSG